MLPRVVEGKGKSPVILIGIGISLAQQLPGKPAEGARPSVSQAWGKYGDKAFTEVIKLK